MRTEPILVTGIAQFYHLPVKLAMWSQYKTTGVRGVEDARDTYFQYIPAHLDHCQHEGATHNKLAKLPSWRTEMKGVLLLLTDKFVARYLRDCIPSVSISSPFIPPRRRDKQIRLSWYLCKHQNI